MNDAGKTMVLPKGKYNAATQYEKYDCVLFSGALYVALKDNLGITPTDDNINWMLYLSASTVNVDDMTPTFTEATVRNNISSGEKLSVIFGKIKKWFSDLKTVAFTGSYNDLSDTPSIGNGTVTIKQNNDVKGTFTMNQTGNAEINLTDTDTHVTVDSALSSTSTNPVQNKIVNDALGKKAVVNVLTSENLNSILTVGFYSAAGGNTCSNKPSDVDAFGLEVIKAAGGWYVQIMYASNNFKKSYRRWYDGSKWTAWTEEKITDTTYSDATQSASGLMSSADKTKLDGIATGANNYSLPKATASVLGGVKVTTSAAVTDSTGLALSATEKNASVEGTLAAQIATLNNDLGRVQLFGNLEQLGLQSGVSVNDLIKSMPDNSIGKFYMIGNGFDNIINGLPFDAQCSLLIFKTGITFMAFCQDIWSGRIFVATFQDNNTVGTWKEIALLNTIYKNSGIIFLNDTYGARYNKIGNIVSLTAEFGGIQITKETIVGTLPKEYCPVITMYAANAYGTGHLSIEPNGNVKLNQTGMESYYYARFSLTYAVEN